jgi:hypothetical protein
MGKKAVVAGFFAVISLAMHSPVRANAIGSFYTEIPDAGGMTTPQNVTGGLWDLRKPRRRGHLGCVPVLLVDRERYA